MVQKSVRARCTGGKMKGGIVFIVDFDFEQIWYFEFILDFSTLFSASTILEFSSTLFLTLQLYLWHFGFILHFSTSLSSTFGLYFWHFNDFILDFDNLICDFLTTLFLTLTSLLSRLRHYFSNFIKFIHGIDDFSLNILTTLLSTFLYSQHSNFNL